MWAYVRHVPHKPHPLHAEIPRMVVMHVDSLPEFRKLLQRKYGNDLYPLTGFDGTGENTLEEMSLRPTDPELKRQLDEPMDEWLARVLALGAVFLDKEEVP